MNLLFISIEESFFIIFIALLIFGPKKIPDIARGIGEGIRYLKNARNKIQNEIMKNTIHNPIEKKKKKFFSDQKENKTNIFPIKRNNK
ncbi:Sec-independent protein translocase subunit TatA/TatB [Blattabacterium cuenoti]|uniref:Sec-independent protein translocase subunit TatA/TatB n=1 Tax=Blattabacterium cuenoti TaxID=1653831 RepID=UPI00163BFB27|nr:twin-arginine translocase TatA/TatE family subunit [Blattabacterium cuenoti]